MASALAPNVPFQFCALSSFITPILNVPFETVLPICRLAEPSAGGSNGSIQIPGVTIFEACLQMLKGTLDVRLLPRVPSSSQSVILC